MAAMSGVPLSGPLKKLESRRIATRWVTKWVALNVDILSYYKTEDEPAKRDKPSKSFDLTSCGFYADREALKFEVGFWVGLVRALLLCGSGTGASAGHFS